MGSFLKVGFSIAAQGTTKNYHNMATAYNRKNALKGGSKRIEGEAFLELDPKMRQEPLETYISFVSPDRLEVANSVYAGRVELY